MNGVETLFVSDVVHENKAHRTSIIGSRNCSVSFLSSCILQVHWTQRAYKHRRNSVNNSAILQTSVPFYVHASMLWSIAACATFRTKTPINQQILYVKLQQEEQICEVGWTANTEMWLSHTWSYF